MGMMASQITSLTIVYSTVYSGADQRKHQRSASLALVRGFHRWPGNSPYKGPVTRKMFPFDDVIIFDPCIWERTVLSIPIQQPPTTALVWNFLKCNGVNFKCHLNIRKHRPWAYIYIYLGDLNYIKLPYIGSWPVSADIFGWTYLYLYLYLNRCICICICIWIKVEENICICICIWKIQIFVFVFVFDKTYLTPALTPTGQHDI